MTHLHCGVRRLDAVFDGEARLAALTRAIRPSAR